MKLDKGLSMEHFTKIAYGVINPQGVRNILEEALIAKLKDTAMKNKKEHLVFLINKAAAKKKRLDWKDKSRQHTVLRSVLPHVDLRPQVDSDKMYFLNEFLKLLAYSENYYKLKQYVGFYNSCLVITFICVQTHHYSLACKVYSMFAQMLLVAGQNYLALELYNKMCNCAQTDKDVIVKMLAYRQMGYTNSLLLKYETAVMCFKYLLSLAWACNSLEGEFAAYEGLSKMYLYIGQIEKAKFYDARISNGIYEPHDTQMFKVTMAYTLKENPWL